MKKKYSDIVKKVKLTFSKESREQTSVFVVFIYKMQSEDGYGLTWQVNHKYSSVIF